MKPNGDIPRIKKRDTSGSKIGVSAKKKFKQKSPTDFKYAKIGNTNPGACLDDLTDQVWYVTSVMKPPRKEVLLHVYG